MIYLIRCKANNRVFIGCGYFDWNAALRSFERGSFRIPAMQLDWNTYGKDSFEMEVLEQPWRCNQFKRHRYYVNEFFSYILDKGYNKLIKKIKD